MLSIIYTTEDLFQHGVGLLDSLLPFLSWGDNLLFHILFTGIPNKPAELQLKL